VWFGAEFNFAILGGDGPDAYYVLPDQENAALASKGQWEDVNSLGLISKMLGMEIALGFGRPATLWRFPIETISNSEAGFERVYQGSCLLSHWRINLASEQSWQVELWLKLREV
jgi:alpha-amylase